MFAGSKAQESTSRPEQSNPAIVITVGSNIVVNITTERSSVIEPRVIPSEKIGGGVKFKTALTAPSKRPRIRANNGSMGNQTGGRMKEFENEEGFEQVRQLFAMLTGERPQKDAEMMYNALLGIHGIKISAPTICRLGFARQSDAMKWLKCPEFLLATVIVYEIWKSEERLRSYSAILRTLDPYETWRPTVDTLIQTAKGFNEAYQYWKNCAERRISSSSSEEERRKLIVILSDPKKQLQAEVLLYEHIWWNIWNFGTLDDPQTAVRRVVSVVYPDNVSGA